MGRKKKANKEIEEVYDEIEEIKYNGGILFGSSVNNYSRESRRDLTLSEAIRNVFGDEDDDSTEKEDTDSNTEYDSIMSFIERFNGTYRWTEDYKLARMVKDVLAGKCTNAEKEYVEQRFYGNYTKARMWLVEVEEKAFGTALTFYYLRKYDA